MRGADRQRADVWIPVGKNAPDVGGEPPSRDACNEPCAGNSQGPFDQFTLPPAVARLSGDVVAHACTPAASSNASAARRWASEIVVGPVGVGGGPGSVGIWRSSEHPAHASTPAQNAMSRRRRNKVNSCLGKRDSVRSARRTQRSKHSRYQGTREAGGNLLLSTR